MLQVSGRKKNSFADAYLIGGVRGENRPIYVAPLMNDTLLRLLFSFHYLRILNLLYLSGWNKKGANRTMKVKRPLRRQRNKFGARKKIMWEEQPI